MFSSGPGFEWEENGVVGTWYPRNRYFKPYPEKKTTHRNMSTACTAATAPTAPTGNEQQPETEVSSANR